MRKARIAEATLSLVTTRDRAAAITGDLLETAGTTARFWSAVARTAARQLWRQVADAPAGAARAVIRIQVIQLGFFVPLLIVFGIVGGMVQIPPSHWKVTWLGVAAWTVISFQTGRIIARRYPGRELAVLLSLLAFQHVFLSVLQIVTLLVRTTMPTALIVFGTIGDSLLATVPDIVVIGGGLLFERARSANYRRSSNLAR